MSWHKPSKRQRAEELGLITPLGRRPDFEQTIAEAGTPSRDLFDLLADRAAAKSGRDAELQSLQRAQREHAAAMEDARLEIWRLQAEVQRARVMGAAREEENSQRIALLEKRLETEARAGARSAAELAAAKASLEGETAPGACRPADDAAQEELGRLRAELAAAAAEAEDARAAARELRAAQERAARAADARNEELELRLAGEARASRLLQEQLEGARAELAAAGEGRREAALRAERAEAEAARREAAPSDSDAARKADAVLISTLRERVAAAEQLAVQVPALRESAREAVFARERLTAAEERCERLEALLASADEAAVEGVAALRTLRRWESELTEVGSSTGPEAVIALVRRQQDEALRGAERIASAAAEAEAARAAAARAEDRAVLSEAEAARLTAALEERRRDAARAERRVALLLRERSGLQAVLSSYDEEYLGGARGEAGIAPQQARLAELEATVEGLHAHVADLEAELERRGAGGGGDAGGKDDASHAASARQLAEAQARADAAEALAERLRAEGEALAARAEALQARVARGDFDPATTRVLHLRLNPEAELAREARDARVARLESENAALAQSLARLEAVACGAGGGDGEDPQGEGRGRRPAAPGADASPSHADAASPQRPGAALRLAQLEGEVSLLRRRANELQKANDRLQQVFRRQITQFREAVYLLFGYRVEMMTDPSAREIRARFVLRPQHEDEGAELVFDLLRSGVLALVPTALTTGRLAQEAATFVDRFRSIPAFTANLTLENFQRQTQS
ncbi:MAD1 [Auxenochlorella protothecoides x Auxenochlorella symbiontica]